MPFLLSAAIRRGRGNSIVYYMNIWIIIIIMRYVMYTISLDFPCFLLFVAFLALFVLFASPDISIGVSMQITQLDNGNSYLQSAM